MKLRTHLLALALALPACDGGTEPCDPDTPNTICTVAGSGEQGRKGDGDLATNAELFVPMDTAIAPNGELWILDFNNYLVRAVDADGIIRTVLGSGELGDSPPEGVPSMPAIQATFNHTTNLFFADGYMYVAAWHNSRVKRMNLETATLENYSGRGVRTFYDGDGGDKMAAALDLPSGIALSPDGDITIMDQANMTIRRINRADNTIDTIVGTCVVELDFPCAAGEVPQACPDSNKLACGDLATECSKPCTPGYGGDGGPAREARLGQPFGQSADPAGRITYDPAGNLIFADTDNHRIRKVDAAGIITTIAGTGVGGYDGDDQPASQAKINRPVDVAAAADGTIYFTDVYNHCVRKIDPDGTIRRVAGTCQATINGGFSGDGGSPLDAELNWPYGVELAGSKLYVTDTYNNRIRVVNLPE